MAEPAQSRSIRQEDADKDLTDNVPPRRKCAFPPRVSFEYEKETRRAFETITGKSFVKARPRFLKNPETGRNLELDGYCEELQMAFEYDGPLHREFPNAFHRTREEFDQQQKRDVLKDHLCDKAKVRLIRVPHELAFDEIATFVQQQLNH